MGRPAHVVSPFRVTSPDRVTAFPIAVDDVLLYNFWRDSPVEPKVWRVLGWYLDCIRDGRLRFNEAAGGDNDYHESAWLSPDAGDASVEGSLAVSGGVHIDVAGGPEGYPWPIAARRGTRDPPPFDGEAHRALEAELKELYTAATRAKVRLLIFDEGDAPAGAGVSSGGDSTGMGRTFAAHPKASGKEDDWVGKGARRACVPVCLGQTR